MSEGEKRREEERTLDGAKAPGWENVAPPPQGAGQPQFLPPGTVYGYQGQPGYPPPPQGQYVPLPPPPGQHAPQGQSGYQPVWDGRAPQGYPPPPGYQGAPPPYPYSGQYPQGQYGNGAEFLAAAALLPWWRRRRWYRGYGYDYGGAYGFRRRRHFFFWPVFAMFMFFAFLTHGCRMIFHGW